MSLGAKNEGVFLWGLGDGVWTLGTPNESSPEKGVACV